MWRRGVWCVFILVPFSQDRRRGREGNEEGFLYRPHQGSLQSILHPLMHASTGYPNTVPVITQINRKSHRKTTHRSTNRRFRSLYSSCPFYGQHRTRSSRTHQLKQRWYSQGKRSICNLQWQDPRTLRIKQAWRNLIYLFLIFLDTLYMRFGITWIFSSFCLLTNDVTYTCFSIILNFVTVLSVVT